MSVVVVTGATGASGRATCAALVAAGHRVAAVGRSADALEAVVAAIDGGDGGDGAGGTDTSAMVSTHVFDLTDPAAAPALAAEVRSAHGAVDGLVHLIGGWRGEKAFGDNGADDWAFLSANLVDTLRHVTLALHDDLVASPAGRAVIVSAAAAATPTAGNANYATAKAAAETWLLALADSFRAHQSGRKSDPTPQVAAAVIGVVSYIGDGAKATSPAAVADGILQIIGGDAADLNGTRFDLRPAPPADAS